jgi:hypothetical protein
MEMVLWLLLLLLLYCGDRVNDPCRRRCRVHGRRRLVHLQTVQ